MCGGIVGLLEVVKHIFVDCPILIEYFIVMCMSVSTWKWFFSCCANGLHCCLSQHNNHLSSWLLQVLIWMVFSEGSLAQLLGTPILPQTRTWLWIGKRKRCMITCLTQRRCVWLMVFFNFIACENSKIKGDVLYTHHTKIRLFDHGSKMVLCIKHLVYLACSLSNFIAVRYMVV